MRTARIEIFIDGNDKEQWSRLRVIHRQSYKAANEAMSACHFQDAFCSQVYDAAKIDRKDMDQIAEIENKITDFFGAKRPTISYRVIRNRYPDIPSGTAASIGNLMYATYRKDKPDVIKGLRSIRSFKENMPIPARKQDVRFSTNEKGYPVFSWAHMVFGFRFGEDKQGNRRLIDMVMSQKVKYGDMSIQYKKNKWYLLLPVEDSVEKIDLDKSLSVGVDLGINIPAFCAVSKGMSRLSIGTREDFLRVRTQLQARKRNLQRTLALVPGGKGRRSKLSALDRIDGKERDFVKTYNHMISKRIVEFSLKNRAGVIKMEFLDGFGDELKPGDFILRNWSYYELQTQIEYKAKRYGIDVVKVDPYHTSQTCSKCGHYEKGQRVDQAHFVCASCGEKMNADHNAALNIARSDKVVTKKEQCQYHKKHKEGMAE